MIRILINRAGAKLRRLHHDEQGADMIEYILIVAAVALPLLGVIIWFWKDIKEMVMGLWEDTKSSAEEGMEN